MFQKKILILVAIVIATFISSDIYRVKALTKDSLAKMEYLDSLYSDNTFLIQSAFVKRYASKRKSLGIYHDRMIEVDSIFFADNDSLDWKKYVDSLDHCSFDKAILEVPPSSKNPDSDLLKVRNKIIRYMLGNYLGGKVGVGAVCGFSKYGVIRDLKNNLTLTTGSYDSSYELLSINGNPLSPVSYVGPIRLPLSDTLDIAVRYFDKSKNHLSPPLESDDRHYRIDISHIPDGNAW